MYRIGIDLGGTNIAGGLVDDGNGFLIAEKASVSTGASRSSEEIAADIASLCRRLCDMHGMSLSDVAAIGIATPGIAESATGIVRYSCNLPFRNFPIADTMRQATGVEDVRIENDANAAAWGEAVAGAAKGTHNSVMITLGTGVGGGIIIDDRIYSGFNGAGAELGHMVIEYGGKRCSCGRRGCWEAYSSATAVISMTKDKLAECDREGRATVMGDLILKKGKISGVTAFDAMRLGDPAGKEIVDMYIGYLACGLTNIVNIFQPEVISLGGGISNEGQSLIDALLPLVGREQYGGGIVKQTELRIAKLGNDAGIIGAAALSI